MDVIIGIDTGGTYTDGVLLSAKDQQILATAKVLTTEDDLYFGILECVKRLQSERYGRVVLVNLSTTLATNSVVKGKGAQVGVILIGPSLEEEIPGAKIVQISGKIDIKGKIREEPSRKELIDKLDELNGVEAIAISGYASVRNPKQELWAKEIIQQHTFIPLVCAHELTMCLGYYHRTVTTALNASLIPVMEDFFGATLKALQERSIDAPIMVVRGDGSIMALKMAKEKPIETILSGPAASITGALHLSKEKNVVVMDVGGTTTDMAIVAKGKVSIKEDGASLGGFKTCVRAADICTIGLGGDSAIKLNLNGKIEVGPERINPISQAALRKSDEIGLTPTDLIFTWRENSEGFSQKVEKEINAQSERAKMSRQEYLSLIRKTIEKKLSIGYHSLGISPKKRVVAVGAPVPYWKDIIEKALESEVIIPSFYEVANAVGAGVAEISDYMELIVRYDKLTNCYMLYGLTETLTFTRKEDACESALIEGKKLMEARMSKAGAGDFNILDYMKEVLVEDYNSLEKKFVEIKIYIIANGKAKWRD